MKKVLIYKFLIQDKGLFEIFWFIMQFLVFLQVRQPFTVAMERLQAYFL